MQGHRYWVERTFEDAKGQCGLADDQVLGWRAWHHHVSLVMLFIAQQLVAHGDLELSTPHDVVEMLRETLPRKPGCRRTRSGLGAEPILTLVCHSSLQVTMDRYKHLLKSESHTAVTNVIAHDIIS